MTDVPARAVATCPQCQHAMEGRTPHWHCPSCQQDWVESLHCPDCAAVAEKLQACGAVQYFCSSCNNLLSKSTVEHRFVAATQQQTGPM